MQQGMAYRFDVTIDGHDVGSFTSLEGLGAELNVMTYAEGGENGFEHRLPGQLKYTTIKLSRPLDTQSTNSSGLAAWFSSFRSLGGRSQSTKTGSITAYDANGESVASWNLVGVYPFRWTGPSFSAEGSSIVKETLELAHHGFIS